MKTKSPSPEKFFVYMITNLVNFRIYIGKTCGPNPLKRWNEHLTAATRGGDDCPKLYNSMRKYGNHNFTFTIIEEWNDENYAYQREAELVEFYDSRKCGLNTKGGGKGGMSGENNPMYGMGCKIAGEKNGMFGMKGELNPFFGKEHTPEFIESIKKKNRVLSNADVRTIKEMLAAKKPYSEINAIFNIGDCTINRIKGGRRYADIAPEIILTESPHMSAQDAETILRLWENNPQISTTGRINSDLFYKNEIEGKYNISSGKIRSLLIGNTWVSIHDKLAKEKLLSCIPTT
jgi:group I intron endonuclease